MHLKNLMFLSSLGLATLTTATASTNLYQQIQKESSFKKIFLENNKYEVTHKKWKNNKDSDQKMLSNNPKNFLSISDNQDIKIVLMEALNHNLVFNLLAKNVQKEYQFTFKTDEIINFQKINNLHR